MAGRLGYKDTNSGEYNAVDYLVQEANEDTLGANSASTLPGTRSGHGRSETTATPRPSPVEESLGPKCRKADERGSRPSPCQRSSDAAWRRASRQTKEQQYEA
ncbi:hypothetical protein OIDMADRAFT_36356 [Oidiodendron maius Zn]|uniref:Uncharacterized protein n=1 Tax=Oidiodendron maius (strain Zn) TaxID=913774 RepID=A0A0C3G944_OIDMZ|nr:hypothetical protein OIDMADRAFT_36356 [Oidiodendron maius Zn]